MPYGDADVPNFCYYMHLDIQPHRVGYLNCVPEIKTEYVNLMHSMHAPALLDPTSPTSSVDV